MKRIYSRFTAVLLAIISMSGCTDGFGEKQSANNNQFTAVMWNVHNLFDGDCNFKNYLSEKGVLFSTFNEASDVLRDTDFEASAQSAHSTSHKSVKNIEIDTLIKLYNEAVLFALLTEHYIGFTEGV